MAELLHSSAAAMARLIRARDVSAVELVQAHLARIDQVNGALNAVVTRCDERALAEAAAADQAVARGATLGALHGVPITLKDSHDTAGIRTTGGTVGRRDHVPSRDATVVARLREAGAIVIGKTNTPECTLAAQIDNDLFGPTHNPYDLTRSPGSSSGGSAAIVAAHGSPLDIGSDTGGSIRGPAHFCGVAGLKPTTGRVPRSGHIVSWGLGAIGGWTVLGPIARHVEDLALTLPIISGPDGVDPDIHPVPLGDPAAVDVQRLRLAWYCDVEHHDTPTDATRRAISAAVAALRGLVASIEQRTPEPLARSVDLWKRVDRGDGGAWMERLLERVGTADPSQQIAREFADPSPAPVANFTAALEAQDRFRADMLKFIAGYDAIIAPVNAAPAPVPGAYPAPGSRSGSFTSPYNIAGWPAAVVRCGTSDEGLPIGLQIVAAPWREDLTLALAALLESALGGWRPSPL